MKKFLSIAILTTIPAFASAESDGYLKAKEGIEPYSTHFSVAELDCYSEGYSWPGILTRGKDAQLQTSEMELCIETIINQNVMEQIQNEKEIDNRLFEIEEAIEKLMIERDQILNG